MLHVFLVDSGSMHTFQMELAMESVGTLSDAIASSVGIPDDKQVLLTGRGETLDPDIRVCNYGSVGTETNPIFLFSKTTIESAVPPSPSLDLGSEASLKEQVEESFHLPPIYETLVKRAQLASEFNKYAEELTESCESLVNEQRWQQQGWASVVANLESISRDFSSHTTSVQQAYNEFLGARERYKELLTSFDQVIPVLGKVPILPCLLPNYQASPCPQNDVTLLEWISAQDHKSSLQDMARQSLTVVEQFDETVLDSVMVEVKQVLEALNNASMKEIKGLDERLSGLQQLLEMVQELKQSQAEMAKGFQQNQMRAQRLGDPSVLPDLCASHQKQLMMLLKNHSQLRDIRRRCARAKDELSANLHTRLRWIMYVEKKICDCDSTLIIYHENIRRLKKRLDILEQVVEAPRVYVVTIAEVVRRRMFASQYLKLARTIAETSNEAKTEEITRRDEFSLQYGRHFLQTLFPGLDDKPPKIVERVPRDFDERLPIITERELQIILDNAPELRPHLESTSINVSMKDLSGRLESCITDGDDTDGPGVNNMEALKSFNKDFSVSQTKGSAMSIDAFTTKEGEDGEGISKFESRAENTSKTESKQLAFMSVAQDLAKEKRGSTGTSRKSSKEEKSKRNSQMLEDSDIMFKSANEDYVTVCNSDYEKALRDADVSNQMIVSGAIVEHCDQPSPEETSQTLTLTNLSSGSGSVSQRTEQGSQTDLDEMFQLPFQESSKQPSHEEFKSAESSDSKSIGLTLENVKNLKEYLALSRNELELSNRKRDSLQAKTENLIALLKKELGETRKMLASTKDMTSKLKTCSEEYSMFVLEEIVKLFEAEKHALYESVSKSIREQHNLEKKQLCDTLQQKELERNHFRDEIEKLKTEKEIIAIKHKEEIGNLRSSLEEYKLELDEQKSVTAKQHESKIRFDEDQQMRFNAIITKLKKEKEQAMSIAHDKLKSIEVELAQEIEKTRTLSWENENLLKAKQLDAETFSEREQQMTSLLEKAEGDLDEMRCTLKHKEELFEKQVQEERSRALLLLEVERQMWEVEKKREKVGVEEQPEKAVDVALEQEFQQQVDQLQVENRILQEKILSLEEAEKKSCAQAQQNLADKGEVIQKLQLQLIQLQQQSEEAAKGPGRSSDKVGIVLKDFQQGDLVMLVFDDRYENYLMLALGSTLYFLHPESVTALDLSLTGAKRRPWVLGRMTDKEYCQAKKPNNRFKVPVGTKFYRIQARPFERKPSILLE